VFAKIAVNGDNEAPLYKYLKANTKGLLNDDIKWNFTKFLIDKNGNVIKRYAPTISLSKIEKDINQLVK
jgi:glutathione peroxidase